MKNLTHRIQIFIFFLIVNFSLKAQNGKVKISQSIEIKKVIKIRTELNKMSSMLKIQIYNGNRNEADRVKEEFEKRKLDSIVDIVYETPNYKIWVGNYVNQLEADIKLLEIKKYYSNAFIFRPKNKEKITEDID